MKKQKLLSVPTASQLSQAGSADLTMSGDQWAAHRKLRNWRWDYLFHRFSAALRDYNGMLTSVLRQRQIRRSTYKALNALSDWELQDIGLPRDQIPLVVEELARTAPCREPVLQLVTSDPRLSTQAETHKSEIDRAA